MSGHPITLKHTADNPINVFVGPHRAVLHAPTLDGDDWSNPTDRASHADHIAARLPDATTRVHAGPPTTAPSNRVFVGIGVVTRGSCGSEPFWYTFIYMQVYEVSGLDGCAVTQVDPGRVESVAAALLDVDEAIDLAELFRLLGDPTRVRILFALLEAGELCVCDIAAVVDTTETKVSQALRLLRNAGVVRNRRDGRNIYYRLDDAHVRMLLDLSREHVAHGRGED